jgi:putative addiction module antidote
METRIGGNIMINTKNIEEKSTAYKIRKSGNSDIVTVPSIVKDTLGISEGDLVSFIVTEESVTIIKEEPKLDVDQIIDEVMNQYDSLLSKLVEL